MKKLLLYRAGEVKRGREEEEEQRSRKRRRVTVTLNFDATTNFCLRFSGKKEAGEKGEHRD